MSKAAIYRNPTNPAIIWELDPNDPAQSEGIVLEYIDVIEKILKEIIEQVGEAKFDLKNQKPYLLHANPFDTVGVSVVVGTITDGVMESNSEAIVGVNMQAYVHGQSFGEALVKAVGAAPFTIGKWDPTVLDALTSNLGGAITNVTDDIRSDVSRAINAGLLAGEGEYAITQRVKATLGEFNVGKRAEMIARTEALDALNTGAHEYYKSRGYKKYRILCAGDERSCDYCIGLDDQEFDIDDTGNRPPYHPHCRCTIVPVIEGLNDMKTIEKFKSKTGPSIPGILPKLKIPKVKSTKTLTKKTATTKPPVEKPAVKPVAPAVSKTTPTKTPTQKQPVTPAVSTPAPVKPLAKPTAAFPIEGLRATENTLYNDSKTLMYKLDDVIDVSESKGFNKEIVEAWSDYTGGGYSPMNKVLRGKADRLSVMEQNYAKRNIEALEKAMTNKVPAGVLYRGVGINSGKKLIESNIGDICVDHGFQSHSAETSAASYFAKSIYQRDPKTGATIYDKAGKVLRRDKVMVRSLLDGNQIGIRGTDFEAEVIIKPGTQWKIVDKAVMKAEETTENVYWHIITVTPA